MISTIFCGLEQSNGPFEAPRCSTRLSCGTSNRFGPKTVKRCCGFGHRQNRLPANDLRLGSVPAVYRAPPCAHRFPETPDHRADDQHVGKTSSNASPASAPRSPIGRIGRVGRTFRDLLPQPRPSPQSWKAQFQDLKNPRVCLARARTGRPFGWGEGTRHFGRFGPGHALRPRGVGNEPGRCVAHQIKGRFGGGSLRSGRVLGQDGQPLHQMSGQSPLAQSRARSGHGKHRLF